MDFILATGNKGKAREIQALFGELHTVRTMTDVGFPDKIIEDGHSFEENATKKAAALRDWLREDYDYILADDSGIEIDALGGNPGVYTSQWLGEDVSYEERVRQTLDILADVPEIERTARFVCVIACINREGNIIISKGILEGLLAHEPLGLSGFGYDPIFVVPSCGRTLAELDRDEKNRISHRAQAIRKLGEILGIKLP